MEWNFLDLDGVSRLWDKITAKINEVKNSIKQSDWSETDETSQAFIKNKPEGKEESAVLEAAEWTGSSAPFTYELAFSYDSKYTNCSVELADGANDNIITAVKDAKITDLEYNDGVIVFTAEGKKPTVDIPIVLRYGFFMNTTEVIVNGKSDVIDLGSPTKPVYFKDGKPAEIDFTIEKSVPADAKFTDTTYEDATDDTHGLLSVEDKKAISDATAHSKDTNVHVTASEKGIVSKLGESSEGTLTFNGSDIKTNTDYVVDTISEARMALAAGLIEEGATVYIKEDVSDDNISASISDVLVPFSTATDAELKIMLSAYYSGAIDLDDVKTVWNVGDVRTVHVSAMAATGVGESHREQDVQYEIVDFDHDELSSPVGLRTKALVSLGQKDCLMDAECANGSKTGGSNKEHGYMNNLNTNSGGWANSLRRAWCNNIYYNALPSTFKELIKTVNKSTSIGNASPTIGNTQDNVFLPSEIEVFGTINYSHSGEGSQYQYYKTAANRVKKPLWTSSYDSDVWWFRSPYKDNSNSFCQEHDTNMAYKSDPYYTYGIAPHICI